MNNDISNQPSSHQKRSDQSFDDLSFSDLDALFSESRDHQPSLSDENFTKVVLNRLPVNPKRSESRPFLFDAAGLLIGFIAAYFFFDLGHFTAQFTQGALSIVPESLSLTVANLATLFGAGVGITVLGWWTAEKALH